MAAATLSADQQAFVDAVARATGLDLTVVTSWVIAESGAGAVKADHNYLNIGPGHAYPSTSSAAAATAQLVNSSSYYAGIRAAIPAGAAAQVDAIKASPWDAGHYRRSNGSNLLDDVFHGLGGSGSGAVLAADLNPLGLASPIAGLGQIFGGGSTGAVQALDPFGAAIAGALFGGLSIQEVAVRSAEVIAGGLLLLGGLVVFAAILAGKAAPSRTGRVQRHATDRALKLVTAAVLA